MLFFVASQAEKAKAGGVVERRTAEYVEWANGSGLHLAILLSCLEGKADETVKIRGAALLAFLTD